MSHSVASAHPQDPFSHSSPSQQGSQQNSSAIRRTSRLKSQRLRPRLLFLSPICSPVLGQYVQEVLGHILRGQALPVG